MNNQYVKISNIPFPTVPLRPSLKISTTPIITMRRKLIIDTDTGVDDAMALLMALEAHKRGQVEVLAITAVTGNTEERHAQRNILRTIGNSEICSSVVNTFCFS